MTRLHDVRMRSSQNRERDQPMKFSCVRLVLSPFAYFCCSFYPTFMSISLSFIIHCILVIFCILHVSFLFSLLTKVYVQFYSIVLSFRKSGCAGLQERYTQKNLLTILSRRNLFEIPPKMMSFSQLLGLQKDTAHRGRRPWQNRILILVFFQAQGKGFYV